MSDYMEPEGKGLDIFHLGLIAATVGTVLTLGIYTCAKQDGYEAGQRDAITQERICYEKTVLPNGLVGWVKLDPCRE